VTLSKNEKFNNVTIRNFEVLAEDFKFLVTHHTTGCLVQVFSYKAILFCHFHGSFNGQTNVEILTKLAREYFRPVIVFVGDFNMQICPMSVSAQTEGAMHLVDFVERMLCELQTLDRRLLHRMASRPGYYTNFSPRQNVDGGKNSDHQDNILVFQTWLDHALCFQLINVLF
jgi:hypothetical protein